MRRRRAVRPEAQSDRHYRSIGSSVHAPTEGGSVTVSMRSSSGDPCNHMPRPRALTARACMSAGEHVDPGLRSLTACLSRRARARGSPDARPSFVVWQLRRLGGRAAWRPPCRSAETMTLAGARVTSSGTPPSLQPEMTSVALHGSFTLTLHQGRRPVARGKLRGFCCMGETGSRLAERVPSRGRSHAHAGSTRGCTADAGRRNPSPRRRRVQRPRR
jgi:hypothetical protein